jgi:hypothetical protein
MKEADGKKPEKGYETVTSGWSTHTMRVEKIGGEVWNFAKPAS